jgi:acyl carrier protein phosphodiesterase
MNYLAHAYLSFNHPKILTGNIISDYVKGKMKFTFEPFIQHGIMLHRAIDTFTDDHRCTKKAKQFLKPHYGLYAGAFIDVVYDHFLATDENEFPGDTLTSFSQFTYHLLDEFENIFPEKFKVLYPYMKSHDWLYNYKFRWAIDKSFHNLVNRATYLTEGDTAFKLFEEHYEQLRESYKEFFPEVKQFARHIFDDYLIQQPPGF